MDWKKFNSLCDATAKALIDSGKPVEAGNAVFQKMVFPDGVSKVQADEMRKAFFAGAEFIFGTIMMAVSEGDEITPADLRRMDQVSEELNKFGQEMTMRHVLNTKTPGHG